MSEGTNPKFFTPIKKSSGNEICHRKIKIHEPRIPYVIKGFLIVGFSSPIGKIFWPYKKNYFIYVTLYIIPFTSSEIKRDPFFVIPKPAGLPQTFALSDPVTQKPVIKDS